VSRDAGFPLKVDEQTTLWKTDFRGVGHASPIVWGDYVFTVSCDVEREERLLVALERATGRVLWESVVLKSSLEGKHRLNSHASSTPATDGERIYTAFLDGDEVVVSAFDFRGARLWEKRPGVFASKHGFSSSPILHEGKVIVNCDHDGDGYMVALAVADGAECWRIDRPGKTRSYCVPLIAEMAGRTQMVLSGSKCVASYDPADGRLLWILDGPTEQFVASLVYHEKSGLLLMTGGFPEHHLLAIKPDGEGQIGDEKIVWRTNQGVAYVPSPVICGDRFYIVSDSGVVHCFDVATGKILWAERVREHHASLAVAEDRVYLVNDFGTLRVLQDEAAESWKLLAESEVGEKVFATPAFSEGQVFIRGESSMRCVGTRVLGAQ
jgi:outer membrane protein assembly factor BamB